MNINLEKCYEAFERLKERKGTHEECMELPLNKITFSKISQEAGQDKGYLKKKRHGLLLSMLTAFLDELPVDTTMGKGAAIKREKTKVKDAQEDTSRIEVKLEAALGRELQLYHALKESEEEVIKLRFALAQYSNVTQLPI